MRSTSSTAATPLPCRPRKPSSPPQWTRTATQSATASPRKWRSSRGFPALGTRQPNQNRNRIWSKLPRQRLKPSHRRRPMRVVELGGEQVAVYEPAPATPGLVKVTK